MFALVTTNKIYLCDYESLRIVSEVELKGEKITCLKFVNGLGIMVIGTDNGSLFFIEIVDKMTKYLFNVQNGSESITKINVDLKCTCNNGNFRIENCLVYCVARDGTFK